MPVDTCPSDSDWGQWVGGLVEDGRASDMESHLATCETCLERVRTGHMDPHVVDRVLTAIDRLTPDQTFSAVELATVNQIIEQVKSRREMAIGLPPETGQLSRLEETYVGAGNPIHDSGDAVTAEHGAVDGKSGSVGLEPVTQTGDLRKYPSDQDTRRDVQLATPVESELVPGLILGAYKIIRKLGQGGMGMVFLAEHQRMKRLVALKVLPPQLTRQPAAIQRFQREVQALARLSHSNIVTAFDADEARGLHLLVMEYVDGTDLSVLVKKQGPLPVDKAIDYITQAARGLEYAHKRGMIHRDIKPSNILVDTEGHVKILDLGLARFGDTADVEGQELTGSGMLLGTADYMAPEQAENTKAADARADIYSLGCTLYYLLTGRTLYTGDTVLARLLAHTKQPIPSLRAIVPTVSHDLDAVYQRAVAKDPTQRFQSVSEFIAALARVPNESAALTMGSVGNGLSLRADAPTQAGDSLAASSSLSTAGGGGNRSERWIALAAGGAALLLLAVVWIIFKDRNNNEVARLKVEPGQVVPVQTTPGGTAVVANTPDEPIPATPLGKTGWHGWPADAPQPAIAPFDAAQAKKHQEEWAEYLKLPVEYTNSIGMKLRLIPPGEFMMGSTSKEIDAALKYVDEKRWNQSIEGEGPQHKVILTQPFYLGVYEVTQEEYETVMGANSSHFRPHGPGKDAIAGLETAMHPVEMVSWNDAADFCVRLAKQESQRPCYLRAGETITTLEGNGYRFPTEAEWEFACRAGSIARYWNGDVTEDLLQVGWCGANSGGRTHAAGELKPNPFGLFDTHGNVWEWVQDGWNPTRYGEFREKPAIDPIYPFSAVSLRVFRGGTWSLTSSHCRSSVRNADTPTIQRNVIGFRVSLSIETVRASLRSPLSTGTETQAWPVNAPRPAIAPFDAAQARQHQEAWAAYLKVPVEYTNSVGMKFQLIPPGEFLMGSTPEEIEAARKESDPNDANWQRFLQSEGPRHKVVHPQPMYLGMTEVTQAEYAQVMGNNPSHFAATGAGKEAVAGRDTTAHPVDSVGWYDAAEFCIRLSERESLNPHYVGTGDSMRSQKGNGYRLPREAEWEFACRAGTTTKRWVGDNDAELAHAGWFSGNSEGRTHAAGELKANPFGLLDIQGNVWEWVEDIWDEKAYQGPSPNAAAVSPSTSVTGGYPRVFRGGSFLDAASLSRSALRFTNPPTDRGKNFGFRVALSVDSVREKLQQKSETGALGLDGTRALVEIAELK